MHIRNVPEHVLATTVQAQPFMPELARVDHGDSAAEVDHAVVVFSGGRAEKAA